MQKTNTILVTGAAGFIGRNVCRHFAWKGWKVIGIDTIAPENAPSGVLSAYYPMRLPDSEVDEILQRHQPDVCIHCAGRASVGLSMTDPVGDFTAGPVVTFFLLNALRQHAPNCRFVFLSSAAVYGTPKKLPVQEDQKLSPLSPYGYHKRQCELLCQEFYRIYKLPTANIRIFSAYGPGLRRQVVWDICYKVFTQQALELHGTGEESRDFIHVSDIAQALYLICHTSPMQGETYNLANGNETRIRTLAETIMAISGQKKSIHFNGKVPTGTPLNWHANIGKIKDLGFMPNIPLDQGIQTVVNWCKAELDGFNKGSILTG